MSGLTVVMMNWKRHDNVRRFVAQYIAMPDVDEVIVWDKSPGEALTLSTNRKLRLIMDHSDVGLVARFAAAAVARTDYVLLVDDDIELPVDTVKELWHHRGNHVNGLIGRRPRPDGTYVIENHRRGLVEIVLTRAAVIPRDLAAAALPWTMQMAQDLPAQPFGNGEDIVLSYTSMLLNKTRNWVSSAPYKNVGSDDQHAISVWFKDHEKHRTAVVRWCRAHMIDDRTLPEEPNG